MRWGLAGLGVLGVVGVGPLWCCAGSGRVPGGPVAPASVQVVIEGDWDDIDAVMAAALPHAGLVYAGLIERGATVAEFRVVTRTGEPGVLRFERADESAGLIWASAEVGRFGDGPEVRPLLEAVAQRFEQLRGKVARPIDWD